MVSIVRDQNADLAILAKKGSQTLMKKRESNERSKNMERFWELAGSKMGKLLEIKEEE